MAATVLDRFYSADLNTAPGWDWNLLASGVTSGTQGRAVMIDCTGTGTLTLTSINGSNMTLHFTTATLYQFNYSIVSFTLGTGAAAVYQIL